MLQGKTAIITGGARGIGKSIAYKLGKNGAKVVIVDLIEELCNKTAEEFQKANIRTDYKIADVSDYEKVNSAVKEVNKENGSVDILVNNAGITKDKLILRMKPEDWDIVLKVNLTGAFNFIKAAAPIMMKQRSGKIINITSVVGIMGNAGQVNYSASKAGMIGLTKSSAKELAVRGINVNAIAPGFIQTEMTDKLGDEVIENYKKSIPMQKLGVPENIADTALFLASAMSDYITGEVIKVDGGMIM